MSKIAVFNLGSTSFKYKIFDAGNHVYACSMVENISGIDGHFEAFKKANVDFTDVSAVGYKAVHGGNLSGARLVDDSVIAVMEQFSKFAPAHNPIYISFIRSMQKEYPQLPQIAYFETSFHATIPEYRRAYGVPAAWRKDLGIRRYGFHGSSHEYISLKMKEYEPDRKRVISIHLGGSSSVCAISDGKSVACSMGATPQSGLFQNNRVGDFDVFCLPALMERFGQDQVFNILSRESGLLGLSGVSGDMRQILKAAKDGNERAAFALDAYIDNIIGYIGMFGAYLGGVDAIALTGGIGFNSKEIQSRICRRLNIDPAESIEDGDARISEEDAIPVYKMKTDEEYIVAKHVKEFLETGYETA